MTIAILTPEKKLNAWLSIHNWHNYLSKLYV